VTSVGGRLAKIAVHSTLEDAIILPNGKKKPDHKMMIDLDCIILTNGNSYLDPNYEKGRWVDAFLRDLFIAVQVSIGALAKIHFLTSHDFWE